MNLARIVRKMSRNLLADECVRQVRDLEATVDRVVIGDGDEIHPARLIAMQLPRIGIAIGKVKTPE